MPTFDYYYYDSESSQSSFCRIPRQLIKGEAFKGLSNEAKLLYALMLERVGLSARNGWCDKRGRVFIYYTVKEIRAVLSCGNDKAIKLLAELDTVKGIGLIERVKQGQGRPAKIFVKNFSSQAAPLDDTPASSPVNEPSTDRTQDCEKSDILTAENQQSRLLETRSLDIGKPECNYIDKNYTYFSYINPSIYQPQSAARTSCPGIQARTAPNRKAVCKLNASQQKCLYTQSETVPNEKPDSGAVSVAVTASTAFDSTNASLLGSGP